MVEKKRTYGFAEIGRSGLNRWGGYVDEEFLPALKGTRANKIYKEMSTNDATIGAIFFAAEQLIRKATWTVEPGNKQSPSPVDLEAAEFVRTCMHDMCMSWSNTIAEILSMLSFGWSYHEIVYKRRLGKNRKLSKHSNYDDGRIGWAKIAGRAQESLDQWVFGEDNELLAMQQRPAPTFELLTIPYEKSLLFRTKADKDNPQGRSLLRNAYRPWYFKKHIEEIEGIGIERDLAGLPVLKTPEGLDIWNTEDPEMISIRNQAERLVRNIRRDENEGIVMPAQWELVLLSTGGRRSFNTNEIINRYDQRIAVTILADIILLGAEKVGSFALSEVKKSLFAAALEAILENIASEFNQRAIPRLIDLNVFPGLEVYPKLVPGEVEVPDLDKLGSFISDMTGAGFDLTGDLDTENYLRQVAGMPLVQAPSPKREQKDPNKKFGLEEEVNKNE
jgi:hypothetical protein